MNIGKRRKVLVLTLLLIALVVAAYFLFVGLRKPSGGNSGLSSSEQKGQINACEMFSTEEAKKIFGDNVYQTSLDNNGEDKISSKIDGAPKAETASSTCAYTKNKLELDNSTEQPAPADTKPAPEGKQKAVDLKPFLNNIKKENPGAVTTSEFLAVITIRSTTQENATTDFNRSKPKSVQAVNGLGDSAFWNPETVGITGKKQGSLSVLLGDKTIIVSGDKLDIETAKKITNTILDKLQNEKPGESK